jgi:hypothetical protein
MIGDPLGIRRDHLQIMLSRLDLAAGRLVTWRKQQPPAYRHLIVGPFLRKVGPHPEHDVKMIVQPGITADLNGKTGKVGVCDWLSSPGGGVRRAPVIYFGHPRPIRLHLTGQNASQ